MSEKTKKGKTSELSEAAKEARRAYQRAYYRRNKEKRDRQAAEYWERRALKMAAEQK